MSTKYKTRASTPATLAMFGNGTSEPFVGVLGVPGRLPTILRLPGESADAFCKRALHLLDGSGPCMAKLLYRSECGPLQ